MLKTLSNGKNKNQSNLIAFGTGCILHIIQLIVTMKKVRKALTIPGTVFLLILVFTGCKSPQGSDYMNEKQAVDYVNHYMGNISHLLVPTFPTVHLPNSMLRVTPKRSDFTDVTLSGLPLILTSHRGTSAFTLSQAKNFPFWDLLNPFR